MSAPSPQHCSFCEKPRAAVHALIVGPGVSICDECVPTGMQIVFDDTAEAAPPGAFCAFCARGRAQVGVLVPGPMIHICDACLQLASDVLTSHTGDKAQTLPVALVPQLPVARLRVSWWKRWFGRR
jgi:ATP-dependent protease Clp ATPase subunit